MHNKKLYRNYIEKLYNRKVKMKKMKCKYNKYNINIIYFEFIFLLRLIELF